MTVSVNQALGFMNQSYNTWRCTVCPGKRRRFYRVQCEHIKRDVAGGVHCICLKFSGVCFCHELANSDDIW